MPGDRIPARAAQRVPISSPPPRFDKVAPWMTTDADPWSEFGAEERATARRLRGHGIEPHSVRELDKVLPSDVTERRGPDAVLVGTERTVEMKTAEEAGVSALKSLARKGRTQARIVVVDGTDVGVTRDVAEQAIRSILGQYGDDLDLLTILLGDGSAVNIEPADDYPSFTVAVDVQMSDEARLRRVLRELAAQIGDAVPESEMSSVTAH